MAISREVLKEMIHQQHKQFQRSQQQLLTAASSEFQKQLKISHTGTDQNNNSADILAKYIK